jgi:hypothetical protein
VKLAIGAIEIDQLDLGARVHVELLSKALDDLDDLQDRISIADPRPTAGNIVDVMNQFARLGSTIQQSATTIARAVQK